MPKVVSWNINSVRKREALVADFLVREQPDLLLLQEIKCEAAQFPHAAFNEAGYQAEIVGQKSYNGVAILHKGAADVTERRLPALPDTDEQARYLEVRLDSLTVGNLYLPNGNSGGEPGYAYKLDWMRALAAHAMTLLAADADFMLAGDYNVCPTDADFASGTLPATDALVRPETRAAYNTMIWAGLTDALRAVQPKETVYTFWDYQAGCWDRNLGMRIDHGLCSPRVAERLRRVVVHKPERAKPTPSDHVPVSFVLDR